MNFLEILFITCFIANFITWAWFVFLGFRANNIWGISVVFLSPVAPFMFASRFARKARRAIYYYIITVSIFVSLIVYIHFFTIDFYTNFWEKIKSEAIVIEEPKPEIITNVKEILPKKDLDANLEIKVPMEEETVEVKPQPKPDKKPKRRHYKEVNMSSISLYIKKNIIVTTSRTKHKGKLLSVDSSVLLIKKRSSGGSVSMPIKKSKIIKIEVYL